MKSLWDAAAREELVARITRLTPENPRRWGTLEAHQMLCHVADQLRMALGDIPTGAPRGFLRHAPIRYLMIHWLPWPKGKARGPREAFTTDRTAWESDRSALLHLIERFADAQGTDSWPTNPIFGTLTGRDWAVLGYRHLDHHLRQFGG